jgi:hypothetical protein
MRLFDLFTPLRTFLDTLLSSFQQSDINGHFSPQLVHPSLASNGLNSRTVSDYQRDCRRPRISPQDA